MGYSEACDTASKNIVVAVIANVFVVIQIMLTL